MFGVAVAVDASGHVQPLDDAVRAHDAELGRERFSAGQGGADLSLYTAAVGEVYVLEEGQGRDRARVQPADEIDQLGGGGDRVCRDVPIPDAGTHRLVWPMPRGGQGDPDGAQERLVGDGVGLPTGEAVGAVP